MSRIVTFNPEARAKLIKGVNILGDAVSVTLGPKGRNVVIDKYGVPAVTKDGVTVAKNIVLLDPVENLGAQIINQAAGRTGRQAGDGTTTSTVIAQELVKGADALITKGVSPITIRREFEKLLDVVVNGVAQKSTPVDPHKIKNIATISANNDEFIGGLIADAFNQVGKEGVLTVEDSRTNETYIRVVEGAAIDRGYVSQYMVTDPEKLVAVYENPYILITDKKIKSTQEIVPIIEQCMKASRALVIIADEIEAQVIALIVVNKMRSNLPVVAVRAPAFGERRGEILQDLAVLTGAELISETKGLRIEDTKLEQLGTCKKVIVSQDETMFIESAGKEEEINKRAEEIKARIQSADSEYAHEKLTERLARLIAKVAVLYVGAATETEMQEKKDRVDDAIRATRAAIAQGFVVGGGMALYNISKQLATSNNEEILAAFVKGLQAPAHRILFNAGYDSEKILSSLDGNEEVGFDASTGALSNFVASGVVDPTLVVLEAVMNATSAANMIALADVTIHDTKEKYQPMDPNEYPG